MFDIGANLTSSHFSDDLDSVLDESFEAGVKKICITSSNLHDPTIAAMQVPAGLDLHL